MKTCYLLLPPLLFISCRQDISSCHQSVEQKLNKDSLKVLWEKELAKAQQNHIIYSAVELSKDTIILLRHSFGLEYSTNGGKTWNWLAKNIYRIDELTVDDKGIWWALERWKGIHEASYCRMHKSIDNGKTWKEYTFNTAVFFPYHFYSKPHQKLAITTQFENTVFRLSGTDPRHNWQFVKNQPNDNEIERTDEAGGYYVDSKKLYDALCVTRKNGVVDTLMRFIPKAGTYNITKVQNTVFVVNPVNNSNHLHLRILDQEKLYREYTLTGGYLYITGTQFMGVLITNEYVAHVYKNMKFKKLF